MEIKTKEGLEKVLKMVKMADMNNPLMTDHQRKERLANILAVHKILKIPNTYEEMKAQIKRNNEVCLKSSQ
jgi:hypothetical protein